MKTLRMTPVVHHLDFDVMMTPQKDNSDFLPYLRAGISLDDSVRDILNLIFKNEIRKKTFPRIWGAIDSIYAPTEIHRILKFFFEKGDEWVSLTALANGCGFTLYSVRQNRRPKKVFTGHVKKYIDHLVANQILLAKPVGMKQYFKLNRESPDVKTILSLFSAQNEHS